MTARRRARKVLPGVVVIGSAVLIGLAAACGTDTDDDPNASGSASGRASGTAVPSTTAPSPAGSAGPATSPRSDTAGGAVPSPTDAAAAPYCGSSRYVEEITVERWADGEFRVSVRPTAEARNAEDKDAATAELWQATLACVAGLDGEVGDSLEDQLRCHQFLALVPDPSGEERYATGETYDLESWRPAPGRVRWLSTRCGNTLGTDPTTPAVEVYRPDGVPPEYTTSGERG